MNHLHIKFTLLVIGLCLLVSPTANGQQWPQWLGPQRNGTSDERGLLKSWPSEGPPLRWIARDCGAGYGGPAVVDGRLLIMGTRGEDAYLFCLDPRNGSELWAARIVAKYDNDWGDGPRSTPTVDGDRVYGLTGGGTLICCRLDNGQELWRTTMQDLGGKTPTWGYSESVLVDGDLVLCTPGGSAGAVAALDKLTGKLVWQSSELSDGAHYSSIIKFTPHGNPQYVQLLEKRLVGLAAEDGRKLWEVPWNGRVAVIPTPLAHENLVYATAGYGAGCVLVEIDSHNDASEVYRNNLMKNHHGGVVRLGDHVYGHSDGVGWLCQDFRTGEQVWRERSDFGKGAIGYADGMLYCLEEDTGTVVLIEASAEGWNETGRFTLEPQSDQRSQRGKIWVHPVIVGGTLYLRDQELLYAFDVRAQ
jgi:outer membrane protein assembly factor BamB